jgi:hypothetical protein
MATPAQRTTRARVVAALAVHHQIATMETFVRMTYVIRQLGASMPTIPMHAMTIMPAQQVILAQAEHAEVHPLAAMTAMSVRMIHATR